MSKPKVGYVNVFASDFDRAVSFFADTIGFELTMREDNFGYASFNAGPISLAVAQTDDAAFLGKHTGIGIVVDDIEAAYEDLRAKGVEFTMPPTRQPWGGMLALFKDPDGNVYYLDPGHQ